MDHKKDYSLLRPFDLEAAKRGEKIAFIGVELEPREFIAGPDPTGTIIIKDDTGQFQSSISYPYVMLPLAWVEGRPVYRGDVLYWNDKSSEVGAKFTALGILHDGHIAGSSVTSVATWGEDGLSGMFPEYLTWQKPKTKREGWVNIYKDQHACMYRYDTKEQAELACANVNRLATISITWEE